MHKILFIVRIDALNKNGGDLVQAKKYKEMILRNINAEVLFAHEISEVELKTIHWDIVQIFNISRIYEHNYILEKIQYDILYLSPIVQPNYKFSRKDYIKSFIRGLLVRKFIRYINNQKIQNIFIKVNVCTYLSNLEQQYFEKTFFKANFSIIIYNGVDRKVKRIIDEKDIDFLIVGRIEKSKNSLFVAEFLSRYFSSQKVLFIGGKNKYHYNYVNKFLTFMDKKDKISFKGIVPYSEVQNVMQRSKILINLSLIEVSPLVDLEALSNSMKVLTTESSFSHLKENECIQMVNPVDELIIKEKLNFLLNTTCDKSQDYVNIWDDNLAEYIHTIKLTLKGDK